METAEEDENMPKNAERRGLIIYERIEGKRRDDDRAAGGEALKHWQRACDAENDQWDGQSIVCLMQR